MPKVIISHTFFYNSLEMYNFLQCFKLYNALVSIVLIIKIIVTVTCRKRFPFCVNMDTSSTHLITFALDRNILFSALVRINVHFFLKILFQVCTYINFLISLSFFCPNQQKTKQKKKSTIDFLVASMFEKRNCNNRVSKEKPTKIN